MVHFKIFILPIVLIVFTTPNVESGFVLDKLRGLAHGFCNLFSKQSPEPTEKTHLFAENIRMETTSVIYNIDVRLLQQNGIDNETQKRKRDIPKHELTKRLFAYNPPICG